ncbi:MAG TPA: mechanosensitive ion channel family protein, partial [Candidatus Binataceae bacterium]|nr:mechanosensitive ion channel family protein [Candidatus Binataceae bacterium]
MPNQGFTPLQHVVGFSLIGRDERFTVELILLLFTMAVGFALRRRHWLLDASTFWMFAVAFGCDLIAPLTERVVFVWQVLGAAASVAFFWAIILLLMNLADAGMRRGREHFSTILRDVVTFGLFTVIVLVALWADFGVNPVSLVVTFGAASVVVGLGLQETLGNIFSGLTLQLQPPFTAGDWVKTGNNVGRVQGVRLRSTAIITRANERLEIPNSVISKDVLVNYSQNAVADEISVGIADNVAPNRARDVILRVLHDLPHVLPHPPPEVLAWEYGDASIRYRVKFWISEFALQEEVHADVVANLWYALRRHAMDIPGPTRTIELRQPVHHHAGEAAYEHEIIAAFRELYFLRELPDNELRMIVPSVQIHQFGAREVLMRQGEEGETLYIIRRGTVEVLLKGADGHERRVNTLSRPAFIGEMALFTG